MSMACVFMMAMLSQVASAEDVVSQMQAQVDQIQTLEFLFHLVEVKGPGFFEVDEKIVERKTPGRLRFRAPHEVRLDRFSESGEILETRVISPDGLQAKHLSVIPESGNAAGLITDVDRRLYLTTFFGTTWLFQRTTVDDFRVQFRLSKEGSNDRQWRVSSVGTLLRMSMPWNSFEYDVDPARGYWIVAGRATVPNSKGEIRRKEFTEPVEFLPGIWIAKHAEYEQSRHGKTFLKVKATVDLDSVRINQPMDAKVFEIVYPTGTRIDNMVKNTSEYVGGRNTRDRKSVEQLAAASDAPAPVAPSKEELIPKASALRVPETSLWNGGYLIAVLSSLLLLGGGWFGWQRWGR